MANNMCNGIFLNILKSTKVMFNSSKRSIHIYNRGLGIRSSSIINAPIFRKHSIQSHVLRNSISHKISLPSTIVLYQTFQNNNVRYYSTNKDETTDINKNEIKGDDPKNEDKKEESKEKKSKFQYLFSNENAWKVGLASLALMGSFLIGQLLVVWGWLINFHKTRNI